MSERCERTSERRSEWPSTLQSRFHICPATVQRLLTIDIGYCQEALLTEIVSKECGVKSELIERGDNENRPDNAAGKVWQ